MNHFMPSNSGEEYVNVEDLRKCKIPEFDWTGRQVWIGVDLALTVDNCAISMVTEEDLKIYADSFAFVPTDRIEEKNRIEKINYYDFIKAGKCFACGDMVWITVLWRSCFSNRRKIQGYSLWAWAMTVTMR